MLFESNSLCKPTAALYISLLATCFASGQSAAWHLEKTIQIGGEGGMDYITVDPANHRLFVPRSTHTLIVDATSGKTVGDIPGQKVAHGVAIVPKLNRGFITDGGGEGSITIFDLKTFAVLGVLSAVPDADGIIYDAGSDRILVSAGDSNCLLSFPPEIDPKSGKIGPPITLGGAPEFLAADGKGKVYINLEDKDTVAVVDLGLGKVIERWPVAPGGSPVGMALDGSSRTLFIGGRKPQTMIIMSADTGKVESVLPIGSGVDATAVAGPQAFASCGDGTLVVIDRSAGGGYKVSQILKTARGAKTLGIDESTAKIYLPTSEFEDLKPGSTDRPKAKPGTFKVLVVSR